MQKVFFTSDHGAFELKGHLIDFLQENYSDRYDIEDLGPEDTKSVDYPIFGKNLGKKMVENPEALGVALCGSGIGISIAVNKVPGVRVALCNSTELAKLGREHNGAQVLAMGQRTAFIDAPEEILISFLETTPSQEERHKRRREILDA
jgi:ribose 5-phosphate isomerase B